MSLQSAATEFLKTAEHDFEAFKMIADPLLRDAHGVREPDHRLDLLNDVARRAPHLLVAVGKEGAAIIDRKDAGHRG